MRRKLLAMTAGLTLATVAAAGWWLLRHTEPSGPPSYTGRIDMEKTYGGHFLLVPTGGTFQDSVSISLRSDTPVRRRDGRPAILTTGQNVSVWCRGPQAESMPPRSLAVLVVIESDGP